MAAIAGELDCLVGCVRALLTGARVGRHDLHRCSNARARGPVAGFQPRRHLRLRGLCRGRRTLWRGAAPWLRQRVGGGEASRYIALAALTIVSSWLLVHTVLALHYTHVCYHIAEESREKPPNVGVVFPNEPQPDFLDFAYFSFVIGMTCQVSDVQITSRRIRRIALLHGLLSFGFNTVILVLSLNLASALLSREGR